MSQISGRLLSDLIGTDVRTVFVPDCGSGRTSPILAKSIDSAEADFVNQFGLTLQGAAAHRATLEQTGSADTATSIDEKVAVKLGLSLTAKA